MLREASKLFVKFYGCDAVCSMCFFSRGEQPQVQFFSIKHNARYPAAMVFFNAFVWLRTMRAFLAISHVLRVCRFAYIFPLVVFSAAVFVVQFCRWPFSFYAKPRYVCGSIMALIYRYFQAPVFFTTSCFSFFFTHSRPIYFPSEHAGCGGIVQNGTYKSSRRPLADFARTWFVVCSHSILQRSFWLEAGLSVHSALLPRLYATRGA